MRPEMSTNMDVACSPATYADSPALSHTRFRPRLMNCRSSRDNEHVDARSTAMYASGAATRSAASSRAPITRTRIFFFDDSASSRESEELVKDEEDASREVATFVSSASTRTVSCLADLVRNADAPSSAGAKKGVPLCPSPRGHGVASARATPSSTRNMHVACSPSAYSFWGDISMSLESSIRSASQCLSSAATWLVSANAGDTRVGSRRFFSRRTSSFSSFPFSRAGEHVSKRVEGAFRRTASPEVDRGSPRKSTSTKCATRHSRATACVTYVSRVSGCFAINAKSSFWPMRTKRAPSAPATTETPRGALSSTSMSPTDSPSRRMLVKNGGPRVFEERVRGGSGFWSGSSRF
mmetsp:Transcript_4153/g.17631  ORF Transcript_4153/g.17631 Transcript_4153/m.17631 type:complete len:353 (+) Transcript_4153:1828-2886(+)